MTDPGQKPAVERAIELVVYAPLGFALFARDMLPPLLDQFVTRGRQELNQLGEKVEQQLGQARIIGQFAVSQGGEQLRKDLRSRLDGVRQRGEEVVRSVGAVGEDSAPVEPPSRTEAAPAAAGAEGSPNGSAARGDPSHLPIPDYDELSASQVVARLAGLSSVELEAVRTYENDHRHRKTVLSRIDQLTA